MTRFFKQPFPRVRKKQLILLISLCAMIQIASQADRLRNPVRATAGYTIVAVIGSSAVVGFFYIAVKQWTRGVIFTLAFTATTTVWICSSLYFWLFRRTIASVTFLDSLRLHFVEVYLIGTICTVLAYLWFKNRNLHFDLQEVEKEKSAICAQKEDKLITLHSDSKDSLTLFPQELLYLESSGNYVQIYYTAESEVVQKTLRTTLSKMEELLLSYPFFVRCHRAFIVNAYQIEEINDLKLCLKYVKTEIPISKTNKISIQNQLKVLP